MNETFQTQKSSVTCLTQKKQRKHLSPVTSSSVRDFDHLKFINETQIKDEVLGKFLERCGDLETAVGKETMDKMKRKN